MQNFYSVVLLLAFAVISFGPIHGQEAPKNSETVVDSTLLKTSVKMADISSEIQRTNNILEVHYANNFDQDLLEKTDSAIAGEDLQIRRDYESFQSQNIGATSKASLDAIKATWSLNHSTVKKRLFVVRTIFAKTNTEIETVKRHLTKWESTQQVLNQNQSPEEIILNVNEVLKRSIETETKLNENLSRLVLMESQVTDLKSLISEIQDSIQIETDERSKDIFKQNAPVIWMVFKNSDSLVDSDSIPSDSIVAGKEYKSKPKPEHKITHWSGENIRFSMEFMEANQNVIYLHIMLWIFTIALSFRFGRKETQLENTANLKFAQKSLFVVRQHLFISATYLAIMYSIILYEFLPFVIMEMLVIGLIVFNVILLYKNQGMAIAKMGAILGLLFLLNQMNIESWFTEIQFRFYLFIKVAFVYWALKLFEGYLDNFKDTSAPEIWRRIPQIIKVNSAILIVSAAANILGFVKLADMSMLLVTQIMVVSFIFYGILITSNGLVAMIFNVAWEPQKDSSIKFRNTVEKMTLKVVNILASLFWIKAILSTVGIYDPIMKVLNSLFSTPLEVGTVSISFQDISYALIVFILTYILTKFIGILISEGALDRFKLERGVPSAISLVIRYTLIALGFMLGLSVAGVDLSSFSLMAGALGIGIGFGLQNIISNFVSGLILVFERPLQEGDVVEVNNLLGIVKNIGVRSSHIRTYTGAEVVMPNEALISKELINWTLSDPNKRQEIRIGVDYDSDPRLINKLLIEAALANSDVKRDPAPMAFFEEFGDSSLNFRLLFFVHNSIGLSVKGDVMLRVVDTMRAHNINIPFPIRTLQMEKPIEGMNDTSLHEGVIDPRKNEDFGPGEE